MKTHLYLTPENQGEALSWEDFAHADSKEGFRYELIHGRLFVSPLPNLPHDLLSECLKDLLKDYARNHPDIINHVCGPARVFLPDLPADEVTAPEPDAVAYANFPHHLSRAETDWRNVSPLVVAEIISEDTADKDLQRNRWLYLRVPSIAEYWIVDPRPQGPDRPLVLVYRRNGKRWARVVRVAPGATYTTPLLPGFTLSLARPPESPEKHP